MVVLHFMLQYLIIVYVVKFFNKKYGDLYVILYMSIII
ncbi:putative core protein [Clostridium perfringens D str. JGS1721]|nr:putative core protein [Clostridium perfringens D str. JGS1721]